MKHESNREFFAKRLLTSDRFRERSSIATSAEGHCEDMFSALPPRADIAHCSWHVCFVHISCHSQAICTPVEPRRYLWEFCPVPRMVPRGQSLIAIPLIRDGHAMLPARTETAQPPAAKWRQ